MKALGRFIAELHRRRVVKVSVTYVIVTWLIMQATSLVFPALLLPEWSHRIVVILSVACFPIVVVLAWVFDISSHGIERTGDLPDLEMRPVAMLPPTIDSAFASICVLPFEVLSSQEDDKYIAQGVCAEIYSALSKFSGVRVVPQSASDQHGARYHLSGNLRRQGDNIRIIVSLSDMLESRQLWSETYHRVVDDVMRVEEEIAGAVVGSFGGEHLREQIKQANEGDTKNATAWSLMHKARSFVLNYSREKLDEAEAFARKAIKLDKEYAAAHAVLADVLSEKITSGLSDNPDAVLKEAVSSINIALSRTPDDPLVLKLAGNVLKLAGQHDDAIRSLRRAVEISAYDFGAWGYLASALAASDNAGQLQEAQEILDRILDMAPTHPGAGYWLHHKALAHTCAGEFAEAVDFASKAVHKQPGLAWAWYLKANAQVMVGDTDGAKASLSQAKAANELLSPGKFADFVKRTSSTGTAIKRRLEGLTDICQMPA